MENLTSLVETPAWWQGSSYLTVMGSRAYHTHNSESDYDFYGFTVPPSRVVFPHLNGEINGFGRQVQRFEQIQHQHVPHPEYGEFDLTVYSIVKYFQKIMEGNPNMVDSLFTPDDCVLYMDEVGKYVRENRKLFLSQKCYHTFKGMMWSHLSRIKTSHVKEGRRELGEKFGWDTKDGYHSVRMLLEVKSILLEGDLDLTANSQFLRDVRNGEFTKDAVVEYCETKLTELEGMAERFVVPHSPDEGAIKAMLVNCLEMKYGSLSRFSFGY